MPTDTVRPMDSRPPAAPRLAGVRVTKASPSPNLLHMSKTDWPECERFNRRLETLMREADPRIRDRAHLSELSGVDQTQLSNWRRGKTRPSRESLRKIAAVLGVLPVYLYIAAGLDEPADLGIERHAEPPIIPKEINELVDLYNDPALAEEHRAMIRAQARGTVLAIRALAADKAPAGRRSPRRRVS